MHAVLVDSQRGSIGNTGKNIGFGVLGAIFIGTLKLGIAKKHRRIILLHIALVTFRFYFGKTGKVIMLMIFGLGGRVHDYPSHLF